VHCSLAFMGCVNHHGGRGRMGSAKLLGFFLMRCGSLIMSLLLKLSVVTCNTLADSKCKIRTGKCYARMS
jgi:hypothetical protein